MRTVVVIPTYNELENIVPLVERCVALPFSPDLYFIDDGSPDGTGELLESLRPSYPRLRVMHRPEKLGLGSAYRQAFRLLLQESYDRYLAMDADLSHRPESIPDLLRASSDSDLVIGSRYSTGGATKNWSAARRLLSRTANQVACSDSRSEMLQLGFGVIGGSCWPLSTGVACDRTAFPSKSK
jgi:glycosyltransferase involved in cell wall biosynthesis